jgi:hypothetical protein
VAHSIVSVEARVSLVHSVKDLFPRVRKSALASRGTHPLQQPPPVHQKLAAGNNVIEKTIRTTII